MQHAGAETTNFTQESTTLSFSLSLGKMACETRPSTVKQSQKNDNLAKEKNPKKRCHFDTPDCTNILHQ